MNKTLITKSVPVCSICNRVRKSYRYATCCSDCPETDGARHSKKCDYFQNHGEHLQASSMIDEGALESTNPMMATRGNVPVPLSGVIIVSGVSQLVSVSKKNNWRWVDAAMEKAKNAPKEACMNLTEKGCLEGHIPLKVMGEDVQRNQLNPNRLLFIRYYLGASTMLIITPRGAIPMMKARVNEFFWTYSDQLDGLNKVFSAPIKHLQPGLRIPAYYWKNEERVYDTKEQNLTELAFGDEQREMVQELIQEVFHRWGEQPVLASEVAIMLSNRFDILLDEEFAQRIYMIKKESLESMEFARIQLMRKKGEQEREEAQQRREGENADVYELWTEASVDLEEQPEDAPDYVPQAKAKGKGRGRGSGGSSSSSSTSGGYGTGMNRVIGESEDWLNVTLRES